MTDVWGELAVAIPTYRRPEALEATLRWLRAQTTLPREIIILDNDPLGSASRVVEGLQPELHPVEIRYVRLGRNAGPAGSYATAVNLLAESKRTWMMCSDDDSEDDSTSRIERYRAFVHDSAHLAPAAIGISGARWDVESSTLIRLPDHELVSRFASSDCIPGPGLPLYNLRELARLNVSFRDELFFGFEELAIGLDIRHHGGLILVDGPAALERRARMGMLGPGAGKRMERRTSPWRSYFRHRNRLAVAKRYGSRGGTSRLAARSLARALADGAQGRRDQAIAAFRGGVDGLTGRDRWSSRYIP